MAQALRIPVKIDGSWPDSVHHSGQLFAAMLADVKGLSPIVRSLKKVTKTL